MKLPEADGSLPQRKVNTAPEFGDQTISSAQTCSEKDENFFGTWGLAVYCSG